MAKDKGEQTGNENTNANPYKDPLFIAVNDNGSTPLGSIIFDGTNFMNWSKSIRIALGAKNKLGFLGGKHPKPTTGEEEVQKWERCDYMVRSWLLATMKPDVAGSLVNMQSTKQLWEEILERYAQTNAPQLFALKKDLWELQQNNLSISEYYCRLKSIWDQIGDLEGMPDCTCGAMSKCSCDLAKRVMDLQATEKLIKFVMGLNTGYDQMKSNLLSTDPLVTVNKAYNLVLQIERQKQITGEMTAALEASALAVNRQVQSRNLGLLKNFQKKDYYKQFKIEKMTRFCEHCGKKGHNKEECFQIVRYPEWYKKGPEQFKSAANMVKDTRNPIQDNPLDYAAQDQEASGMKQDNKFMNTLVQEVIKAIAEKQGEASSSQANFAGPFH
ncbi:uncharacterized protein LOC125497986 [Beta vulgaris subsp. vulgaris]|uniref:uncharacterized protein LOC125497986 n=1 Tax=Beta vulgaris subsp. vulgaris TaxID=3555 RepID=UPI00203687DF|nr:uncharacterized protein LOC125497986 [Beta vulgaris subsp. vulgaris]